MKNKNIKKYYDPKTYKPTKNSIPVEYNGKKYLSKAQCMALEGITRKELDEYLNKPMEGFAEPDDVAVPFGDPDEFPEEFEELELP